MNDFCKKSQETARALRKLFDPTPLQRNDYLSVLYEADIWLKREDLSPVRSYKLRGAFNRTRVLVVGGVPHAICIASMHNTHFNHNAPHFYLHHATAAPCARHYSNTTLESVPTTAMYTPCALYRRHATQ